MKGLVAVERFGMPLTDVVAKNSLLGEYVGTSLHLVPQPVLNDVSSTKIRYVPSSHLAPTRPAARRRGRMALTP